MSNRLSTSNRAQTTNYIPPKAAPLTGIVIDVILNEDHTRLNDSDDEVYSGKDFSAIGSCLIRPVADNVSSTESLIKMKPYDALSLDVPLIGETVELLKIGSTRYYRRIPTVDLNKGNAVENVDARLYPNTEPESNQASSYSTSASTGIPNSSGTSDRDTVLGEYFEPTQANSLLLYEGDKLLQSRFGQSIRFSGYNNEEKEMSPTIIIRNRQSDKSLNELKQFDITEEDVNRDGSSIVLSSNKYQSLFQPGTVDDGGSTDFETTPDNFMDYPSELDGDQIIMNSGRIILSSKTGEMIFYSKGNWGFISDGFMSIDNGEDGAYLNFNGEFTINTNENDTFLFAGTTEFDLTGEYKTTTNDNDMYFLGGSGRIFLNIESDSEPLIRGETLKGLLEELIDAINKQVFATPAGPTSPGPVNAPVFESIKSRLQTMLSTLNYTE